MAITKAPSLGTVLLCDFDQGFKEPEMVKRRPVVVVSPQIAWRPGLCTVVGLSTSAPEPARPYNCQVTVDPPLPHPWDSPVMWVKGDMIAAVGFHRLDLVRLGRDGPGGRRLYRTDTLTAEQMKAVRRCVLHGLGLFALTKHL